MFPKRDSLQMIGFMLIFFGLFAVVALLIFLLFGFVLNWIGQDLFRKITFAP